MKTLVLKFFYTFLTKITVLPKARPSTYHSLRLRASTLLKYILLNFASDILNIREVAGLRDLKKSKLDRNALVLGNGPSLNKASFEKIKNLQAKDLDVFVVNYFPLFENMEWFKPNYLVLSDEGTRPTNPSKRTEELWNWIESNPNVRLCVPYSWKNQVARFAENVIYFNDSGLEGISRNINPIFPRGYASMTAYKAMSIATYLGYSKVYILGIDNSNYRNLSFTPDNQILQHPFHFREYGSTVNFTQSLGFNAGRYFLDLAQILEDCELFQGFEIFNLDIESVIDAFEKVNDLRFLRGN